MKLLVGLGNPGAKYARNRHNIGFMALDRIAVDHRFAPWKPRFQGQTSDGRLGTERVMLLKPDTFMNLSGQAVGAAARYLKLDAVDVIVLHDELDLAPGKLRLKVAGGAAGHNGLRSIIQHIGADFTRLRLGIGHPGHKDAVAGYVLHDFARADEAWLDNLTRAIAEGAPLLAAGEGARFLNVVSQHLTPARNTGARSPARDASPTPDSPPDPRSALQRLADRFR